MTLSRTLSALLLACALAGVAGPACALDPPADPRFAVVRIRSHGASATVIATEPGRSWILGCCHAYLDRRGKQIDQSLLVKPHKIDCAAGQPIQINGPAHARLVAYDSASDLSLLEVSAGPLWYWPIAPPGHKATRCATAGFDEMREVITFKPATLLQDDGRTQWTREPPWHGRSGGALLDLDHRMLIGVVQAYSGAGGRPDKGLHCSLQCIHRFMAKHWANCPAYGRLGQQPAWPQAGPGAPQYAPQQPQAPPGYAPAPGYLPYPLQQGLPQPQGLDPYAPVPRRTWIEIAQECRVPNRSGSQCAWCALETLGRHHRIPALYGLTQTRHGTTGPGEVARVLGQLGVRHLQNPLGNGGNAVHFVKTAGEKGLGCLVGLGHSHAVTCAGIDGDQVIIIDNAGPKALQEQRWTVEQFRARADGWCVVVYPDGHPGPPQQPDDNWLPRDDERPQQMARPGPRVAPRSAPFMQGPGFAPQACPGGS